MKLCLYGAGGHARVVIDILHRQGRPVAAVLDDDPGVEKHINGVPVLQGPEELGRRSPDSTCWIVTVGNLSARRRLVSLLKTQGHWFVSAVDPSVQMGSNVEIGEGTVVMPNAIINAGSRIGAHTIINTASSIDHDSDIGDFCHVSPGCTLCGDVTVEHSVLLGVGAKVGPGVSIGAGSVVGAGAVLLKSIPAGVKAWGVPARIIGETS